MKVRLLLYVVPYGAAVAAALWVLLSEVPVLGRYGPVLVGPMVNTLWTTAFSLALVAVVALPTAIYLVTGSSLGTGLIETLVDGFAAAPSVVVGLFGLALLVRGLHLGFSLLAGGLTLGVFNLPFGVRLFTETLRSVPDAWLEASYALGAGVAPTVRRLWLPAARAGLMAGLGEVAARSVGESALLYLTAGVSDHGLGFNPLAGGATLSVKLYYYLTQGRIGMDGPSGAVSLALVIMGMGLELLARWIKGRRVH